MFRDQQFSAAMMSAAVRRVEDVNFMRSLQFVEDASPMAHPVQPDSYMEVNNFYTVTVYHKGAEIIRMLHTILGEKLFREGMDLYFERYDGQAVTFYDFICAIQLASVLDLPEGANIIVYSVIIIHFLFWELHLVTIYSQVCEVRCGQ